MPLFTATKTNTMKTNYVPPALRSTLAPSTKKMELKKGFALEQAAFPSLGETIKKSKTQGTPISFSSAAAKKIEEPQVSTIQDVLPGWVHIRWNQGKIQYKYGKLLEDHYREDIEDAGQIRSRIILKNRIAREEYDRMRDIENLGDLSEFYGQPTLAEMYEQAMEAATYDDNDSSDYMDSDQYE